jgi:hypothetical protein
VCRLARPTNRWLKRPTPNASRRCHLIKSSTATRSCSYGLFPWAALLRFAFGQKIWHTIFFSSKPNFKIFPKLLLRRRASQSPKRWPVYGSSALSGGEHLGVTGALLGLIAASLPLPLEESASPRKTPPPAFSLAVSLLPVREDEVGVAIAGGPLWNGFHNGPRRNPK